MLTRRNFGLGLTSAAFGGLALAGCSFLRDLPGRAARNPDFRVRDMRTLDVYGPLVPDPNPEPIVDLPARLRYTVVSEVGQMMDRGGRVPPKPDGMGSFALAGDEMVLVRNHEDEGDGGTTTIVYDYRKGERKAQYRSLAGTRRNCSGGVTPWGTWLTCEEDTTPGYGFVYEVPAIEDHRTNRTPLRQLGRFNHEAAVVDPETNCIYMTEDQIDGLLYRFVPENRGDPLGPGQLQALAFVHRADGRDSRNWGVQRWREGEWRDCRWIPLSGIDTRDDDLRKRGYRDGAVRFACGEGVHFGRDELYFTCTSGGIIKSGQIFRLAPSQNRIQLFLEATDPRALNYCDNLVLAPNGDLILCEDAYVGGEGNYWLREIADFFGEAPGCYLRGVTPDGQLYKLARVHGTDEFAGACFSPDGCTLFVNVQGAGKTLAITGDWAWSEPAEGWRIPSAGAARQRS